MTSQWDFLKGTYWYVPATSLPALQMSATESTPTFMIDQTVWQITDYRYGYFWGNCAALLYEEGTSPDAAPEAFRMAGSVTPEGNVQISFMPINQLGASLSTSGWGRIKRQIQSVVFEMQMASGVTDLVAHWAYMDQTKEGYVSWEKLPGTDYSVPEFMQAAGF